MAKHTGFNSIFRFKKFSLQQGPGVFRLGTDAVLLGCWAHLSVEGGPILDVGTGTGVLALMAAQRTQRQIWAIDVAPESATLAQNNADSSPWFQRIQIFCSGIEAFIPDQPPSDILFNPPYFLNHTPNVRPDLTLARHGNSDLPLRWLGSPAFAGMEQGNLHLIVPSASFLIWEKAWKKKGWFVNRQLCVKGRLSGPIIRSVLSLSRTESNPQTEEIYLYEPNGDRSAAYQAMSSEFYL
jgi:tRNA1Val (adenine37-N6)-methyltransferase